ncbi:hypothetical protein ACTXT7_015781 [Hymenolepis weldensis]
MPHKVTTQTAPSNVWFQNARARKKKCGSTPMQIPQIISNQQSEGIQEESAHEFPSIISLNEAVDLTLENDSEAWMSSPISSQLSCSTEDVSMGQFFTQGSVI